MLVGYYKCLSKVLTSCELEIGYASAALLQFS